MKAAFESIIEAGKTAWLCFCGLVVFLSFLCWIDAVHSLSIHHPNWFQVVKDQLGEHFADYFYGHILDVIFDVLSNSFALLVGSTAVGGLYIMPIAKAFREDVIGVPKQVGNFFRPLEKVLNEAAKIELGEVELRARAVLEARARVMTHISGLYGALWFDFKELEDLVGPDGSPPVNILTEKIPIESNLKCTTCGGLGPCGCHGGAYVEARKIEAEKRGESLMRMRAALDRLTSRRRTLRQTLDGEMKNLLLSVRAAKDYKEPKSRDQQMLDIIRALLGILLLLSLAVLVLTLMATRR